MLNWQTELAWQYHNLTKHSYMSVRTSPHYLDWDNQPSPFKIYPEAESVPLPRDIAPTRFPTLEAIASDSVAAGAESLPTLEQVASLLYHSAGVTRSKEYPGGVFYFRAAACAGALYPIEVYVVCGDIEGLDAGVYHFNPGDFSLARLRSGDYRAALADATAGEPNVAHAPVVFVYTAMTWRSAWKYRDRAYRYHYWDNGTIVANALAVARGHELPAAVVMGFVDEEMNRLVGIDGERELATSLLSIGRAKQSPPPSPEVSEINLKYLPLSREEVDYPSIREMHRASSLADRQEVKRWREGKADRKSVV
jgi:SagB-type dehydrogenase family enzyme